MGLDTTHNAWHGAYSSFMRWRTEIARAAGFPPLGLMEGFYDPNEHNYFTMAKIELKGNELALSGLERLQNLLPIKWECLKESPLNILLYHSDCDGEIEWKDCKGIADELTKILPNLTKEDGGGHIGNYTTKTQQFIDGLMLAYNSKENLKFQ